MEQPDRVVDLGGEVHLVDTEMGGFDAITAAYLIRSSRPALVETGAARSADAVVEALARLGIGSGDLATIVVTHIHLDHAGGVGDLAAAFPSAEVVVHERGARHLADPSRLMASARQVFGSVLDEVFGELLAVPAERLRALGDRDEVDLGDGRRLATHWSPGHASHHVGLLDSETGDLYVGDAAGVWVPEVEVLKPATPPPDFDLETAVASIDGFRALRPERLLFSHFGPVEDPDAVLARSAEELRAWVAAVAAVRGARPEQDLDHAVAAVVERTRERYAAVRDDPALAAKHEALSSDAANVSGVLRWLDKQDAAAVPGS